MSDIEVYGLMAAAKDYQSAADKAIKGMAAASLKVEEAGTAAGAKLDQAARIFDQARMGLAKTAQEAIKGAVAAEAAEMAVPLQKAAESAREAAQQAKSELAKVSWLAYAAAFSFGALAGVATTVLVFLSFFDLSRR